MTELKTEWFVHMGKCGVCGWRGPLSEITQRKRMNFTCEFYVCPKCGNHRRKGERANCISCFAVHSVCGKWHPEGTPCSVPKEIK